MADRLFFVWQAEEDMAAIYAAIAETNRDRALEFLQSIHNRCLSLLDFPYQGRDRSDLLVRLRILAFRRSVRIAYRVGAEEIEILRVFHGQRDYERELRRSKL